MKNFEKTTQMYEAYYGASDLYINSKRAIGAAVRSAFDQALESFDEKLKDPAYQELVKRQGGLKPGNEMILRVKIDLVQEADFSSELEKIRAEEATKAVEPTTTQAAA